MQLTIIYRATDELIPYARNSRTHSEAQISQIAGSIKEFGFTNPILIDDEGGIIAGHGRVMAAQKLGMETVPTICLGHLTETQRKAYVIADNKLALNAGWDEKMLALELSELRESGYDLALTGFDGNEIEKALNPDELSDNYTHKVDAPVYEPKGDMPSIAEMADHTRSNALIDAVKKCNLSPELESFLIAAAARHVVFDYGKIAEFYCHADAKVQSLMEDSALVIIDFNKALQLGYAKMRQEITEIINDDK